MNCRHCNSPLNLPFLDLGSAPPSNAYLTEKTVHQVEQWFPLRLLVCEKCWLVQTEDFSSADTLFTADYAYFSSFSDTWVAHCKKNVSSLIQRFSLGLESNVIEIAANDGCLLQFVQQADIPCFGVEPTTATANAAREKGLTIIEDFFGKTLAKKLASKNQTADLIIANNVLAHVPDINDFIEGISLLLKPHGTAVFEFPHLLNLVEENQFDTIYHEHYSYLSLSTVRTIFKTNGLHVFDVEQLPTHGGSLRVYAQRNDNGSEGCTNYVQELLTIEKKAGMTSPLFYSIFQDKAEQVKNSFLMFLLECKQNELSVAAYGAAAKGNTLLNFAGIRPDLLQYVVDRNPAKQGKFMPGSRIPIFDEEYLKRNQPDRILILPWNLHKEISAQLHYAKKWDGKFITVVPQLTIH